MRYWESRKTTRKPKKKPAKKPPKRSIALGGSVREYPFLRTLYQHQAVISDRIQKFVFFLILATLIYAFVFGDGGAIRIISLRSQKAALAEDVALITRDATAFEHRIESLDSDPFLMEQLGRERYGYIQPGDRVYKIVHPDKTDQKRR